MQNKDFSTEMTTFHGLFRVIFLNLTQIRLYLKLQIKYM